MKSHQPSGRRWLRGACIICSLFSQTSGEGFTPPPTPSPGSQHRGGKLTHLVRNRLCDPHGSLHGDARSSTPLPSHLGAPLEAFWARFGPSLGVQNRAIWAPLQGVEGSCCRNDGFSKIIEKPMVFQHFGLVWAFQKGYKSSIICSKTASQIIFVYDSLRMPFWNSFHPFGRPFWAPKSLQESLSGAI